MCGTDAAEASADGAMVGFLSACVVGQDRRGLGEKAGAGVAAGVGERGTEDGGWGDEERDTAGDLVSGFV